MRSQPAAAGRGAPHANSGRAARLGGGWLYYAACAALLIAAAALRLYDLGGADLRSDEAVDSIQAQGSLANALEQLRCCNTTPPLNALFLWAAQRIAISEFSVRLPAAAASVLTVAVLIFLLPKVGVARPAALLAGLMAAVSAAALLHAHDARGYGMDALIAALIIAGLLACLKDGKRALLCVSLLIAPLAQYGLALFAAAALGTLAVSRSAALFASSSTPDFAADAARTSPAALAGRGASVLRRTIFRLCLDLAWPSACFLAGLAGAYALALREQLSALERIQGYLAPYYYASSESGFAPGFALAGVWDTLRFHLPPIVALAGIAAMGAALVARRRDGARLNPIGLLFALSLAVAAAAGALSVYPLGGVRQNMYLGPIVFAAFGCALHAASVRFPPRARIAWAAALAAGIAVAGAFEIAERNPYGDPRGFHRIIAALEEAAPNDAVYAAGRVTPITQFYQDERADAYAYGNCAWGSASECLEDLRSKTARVGGSGRAWLILGDNPINDEIDAWMNLGYAERAAANSGGVNLYLIRDRRLIFPDEGAALQPLPTGEPSARGVFDVYVVGSEVVYLKEACVQADTEARFFLHFVPQRASDLPDARRGHGFDNADFDFFQRGGAADGKCVARVPLPAYEVRFIRTGQFISGDGVIWRREFPVGSPSP